MKDEDDEKIELGEPDKLDFLKRAPRPYTCPVCGGRGFVPCGFYNQFPDYYGTTSTAPEVCRSCAGAGVLWG